MDSTAHVAASRRLTIDVSSDVLCPWCYLGEQRLSTAIEQSPWPPSSPALMSVSTAAP
jgi:hypothetical protein